jgi:asparagine synthase (glutamine-hydrolysing)
MCGIAGALTFASVPFSQDFSAMMNCLKHRGPDAEGVFVNSDSTLTLIHTRLSIIDLTTSANQPFYSADGRYVLIFNGEIFNYKAIRDELAREHKVVFKTSSDTEVIAEGFAVWGKKIVFKLEGMFAFAITDLQENKLFLVRDRVGKKPLYYCEHTSGFYFASEIKALLKISAIRDSLSVNAKSISTFLHLGYIPEPDTIYSIIKKFPAGSIGEVTKNGKVKISVYWNIESSLTSIKSNLSKNKEKTLQGLLDASVESRLISDVPLGAFLSGGTDSSLVTAIASKFVSSPLRTFSIGFKESNFDERKYAEGVAKELSTNHTAYELSQQDAIELVDVYLQHFDEPFADTSAIPTMLVSQLARKEVTVALTGDGGDELFQGYGSYTWANRLNSPHWKLLKYPLRTVFDLSGDNRMQRVSDLLQTAKYGGIRSHIFSQEQYFFSQKEIQEKLLVKPDASYIFEYNDPDSLKNSILTPGEFQALFDFHYYLKDDLLTKVDRASMYYGLEARCPLLDHHVIEFAFALDINYKVRDGETKWILKQLLGKYLPDKLVYRVKKGFGIPLAKWLKGDLHYLIEENLNEALVTKANLVKYAYIHKLLVDFYGGKDYLYHRLWLLIVLHKWWKRNQ